MTSDAAVSFQNALLNAKGDITSSARISVALQSTISLAAPVVSDGYLQATSDENLLVQVSRGEKAALSVLFQRHARAVYNVSRRILKDDSEAEDLLQELFLFIFQKAQTFDPAKSSA